jgi:hypothetical protein
VSTEELRDIVEALARWELHGVGRVDPDGYVSVLRDELDDLRTIRQRARAATSKESDRER